MGAMPKCQMNGQLGAKTGCLKRGGMNQSHRHRRREVGGMRWRPKRMLVDAQSGRLGLGTYLS